MHGTSSLWERAGNTSQFPTSNYVNPVTRGNLLLVLSCIFGVLTTLAIGIRIYTRAIYIHSFGVDDTLMVVGYVSLPHGVRRAAFIT
jgi:hypothetical protein